MYIVQYTYININIYLHYLSNPLFSISKVSLSFMSPQLKTLLAGDVVKPANLEISHKSHDITFMGLCVYKYIYISIHLEILNIH